MNGGAARQCDLDRPLGKAATQQGGRMALPGAGAVAGATVCLAVLAVSGAISLAERPFRSPPAIAVSTPVDETGGPAVEQAAVLSRPAPAGSTGGPSIIRVEPPAVEDSSGVIVIRDPTAANQDRLTAHLPDRALIEDSEFGMLPRRAGDGRRPFDVYARPWSGARGARVAIVIGGLGLSQTGTQTAIETLPGEVTLGFAPQGNSLDRWMQAARRAGHEIVLQLPLEPFDYPAVDPGRNTLTVEASAADNVADLKRSLVRLTNYVGVMNYMGGRFVAEEAAMAPVMAELGRRGLMYLDDGSTARSVADRLAAANGVPFAAAEIAIDATRDRGAILTRLDEAERVARARGYAVATGSAFDVTVDAVAGWVAEARRRGIEIVPVSALADDPER